MKYATPLLFFLVLLTVSTPNFSADVAAVCKGEAYWAIRDCACTVSNRLNEGATEESVLESYYATPIPATMVEVSRVHALLTLGCPQPYHFMYSLQDVHRLGISHIPPLKILPSPTSGTRYQVWFYEEGYLTRDGGD
jgi:hypothetical protein